MWLLVKVKEPKDFKNNEEKRYLVLDEPIFEKYSLMIQKITFLANEVHPMTKGD